jgi:hypothetical protein
MTLRRAQPPWERGGRLCLGLSPGAYLTGMEPTRYTARLMPAPLGLSSTGVERRYASTSGHWQNSV